MKQLWFQRTFIVLDWPPEAIERLKTFAVGLDAAADFCGQPRGSIVLSGTGAPSVKGTGPARKPETKVVGHDDILGRRGTSGEVDAITKRMIELFGNPKHDKNFHMKWTVPADWTYPQE